MSLTLTECLLDAGAVPVRLDADGGIVFKTDLDQYESARQAYVASRTDAKHELEHWAIRAGLVRA